MRSYKNIFTCKRNKCAAQTHTHKLRERHMWSHIPEKRDGKRRISSATSILHFSSSIQIKKYKNRTELHLKATWYYRQKNVSVNTWSDIFTQAHKYVNINAQNKMKHWNSTWHHSPINHLILSFMTLCLYVKKGLMGYRGCQKTIISTDE